jgi:ketosteroid isomerase-like protein
MSDYEEICQVIALIGHLVDHQQWDRLDEVFTEDGTFVLASGAVHEGLDAVRAMMLEFTHPLAHYTTNIVVDVAPDGASAMAISKCINPHRAGHLVIADYADELVRTDAGWRIRRRAATILARWPVEAG